MLERQRVVLYYQGLSLFPVIVRLYLTTRRLQTKSFNTYFVEKYKFIRTSLRNRTKSEPLVTFLSCFETSTNTFNISPQCTHIVFILKCCFGEYIVKVSHKKAKLLDILDTFRMRCLQRCSRSTGVYCASLYTRHENQYALYDQQTNKAIDYTYTFIQTVYALCCSIK